LPDQDQATAKGDQHSFVRIGPDRQIDTQTDGLITMLRTPNRGNFHLKYVRLIKVLVCNQGSLIISQSVDTRLQVSVCSGYDLWLTSRQTHRQHFDQLL